MVEIRELAREEYEQALQLALKVFLEFNTADSDEEGIGRYRQIVRDQDYLDCLRVYGAYDGMELTGIIATRDNGTHIAQFYVDGAHQHSGTGRLLFERALADNETGFMTLDSSSYAVPVYRAFGFSVKSENHKTGELRFTSMERIELHYIEEGIGKPLILLHGNGEDVSYFREQMAPLSEGRRVIAVDTRGHGSSPRGTAAFTIRQFAEDLRCFMCMNKIEKADILGFSDGGNIALRFAMMYPELVDRLIVDGANLDPSGVRPIIQIPVEIGYLAARALHMRNKAELLGLMVNDPDIRPAELLSIKAKTLVMAGTDDMIKREHTELIAGSIPDAELRFIAGDHFIARKNPGEFNRAVADFLTI
jgi:pimeloyl-ACP methyl ester carboxylesterase/predicted GNAT family N-acyltransferase